MLCYPLDNSDVTLIAIFYDTTLTIEQQHHRINREINTVKPVLSGHSKMDKTKVLKTNGSLMKVKSIAECSLGAFCNIFDLH